MAGSGGKQGIQNRTAFLVRLCGHVEHLHHGNAIGFMRRATFCFAAFRAGGAAEPRAEPGAGPRGARAAFTTGFGFGLLLRPAPPGLTRTS